MPIERGSYVNDRRLHQSRNLKQRPVIHFVPTADYIYITAQPIEDVIPLPGIHKTAYEREVVLRVYWRQVVAPEAVIYIKSEDNYVQIHYQDQNRTKKFILRSSMKALEETLAKRGLVRCHRSYFINPAYIKIVHRDNTGIIVAELKQENYESIPISRKYQDAITRLL